MAAQAAKREKSELSNINNSLMTTLLNHELPSEAELEKMFFDYKNGPEAVKRKAKQDITLSFYRWSAKIALRYSKGNPELQEDLAQAGVEGIDRAIRKYDPESGVKFITYSQHWIRLYISTHAASLRHSFKMSENVRKQSDAVTRAFSIAQGAGLSRKESISVAASKANMDTKKAEGLIGIVSMPVSLSMPLGSDEDSFELSDTIACERESCDEKINRQEVMECLNEALNSLPFRSAQVIRSYYGLGQTEEKTFDRIGQDLGVSRQASQQMQVKSIKMLKDILDKRGIRLEDCL